MEGTNWNARWEAGDTPWDHGEAAPPLREWLSALRGGGSTAVPAEGLLDLGGRWLVPGCGSGNDVRFLADAFQTTEFVGLDLAPEAIRQAEAYPRSGRERYLVGSLADLPSDLLGTCDGVFEHTCLCALEPPAREIYRNAVLEALKPAGHLLGIFFLDVGRDGGPPWAVSEAELETLLGPELETVAKWTPSQKFPSRVDSVEQMRLFKRCR
ncbi:MAG: methyltransferase domain-containing protein [Opitutales bacterium]